MSKKKNLVNFLSDKDSKDKFNSKKKMNSKNSSLLSCFHLAVIITFFFY